MPETSSRRCAVSSNSLASGPNGQPIALHADQNHRSSSSVNTRSRARSLVGDLMPMVGEEARRSFSTAQFKEGAKPREGAIGLHAGPPLDVVDRVDYVAPRNVSNRPIVPSCQVVRFEYALRFLERGRPEVLSTMPFKVVANRQQRCRLRAHLDREPVFPVLDQFPRE